MLSITHSVLLNGLDGYLVRVEVDVSNGLPGWEIVGLPDTSIKEAKERVRIAIKNSGFNFPSKKIIVNLAPAYTRKEGSLLDLPIAIGILSAIGFIKNKNLLTYIFAGELSLNGSIEKTNGILPICIEAKKLGISNVILSSKNANEASFVEGIKIIPATNLIQIVKYLNHEIDIPHAKNNSSITLNNSYSIDFSEVKGQESAKRALEVAAAGGHNLLMIGSPGAGKTMLAQRLPTILPDLTFDEALEVTKIHSIVGQLDSEGSLITKRPFRAPHHSISLTALIGGGRNPIPGEISLSHYGVLFLDELTQFSKPVLESLRVPLEDAKITISRLYSKITYPAKFMLVASMNPCVCGYLGSKEKECTCSLNSIANYTKKISGPFLDRIDICITVHGENFNKLNIHSDKIESSSIIKSRVDKARAIQVARYANLGIFSNAELSPKLINEFCSLSSQCKKILKNAFEKFGFSSRAYCRILKVARTIADLEGTSVIEVQHVSEAIQYRVLDRRYK